MEAVDILIVDDNNLVRQGIAQSLRRAGYKVDEFHDPNQLLTALKERKKIGLLPRLVISDFTMPQIKGAEMVKIIRTLFGLKTLPIVMVSAEINAAIRAEAEAAGITAWVQKSKILIDLLPVVQQHAPI